MSNSVSHTSSQKCSKAHVPVLKSISISMQGGALLPDRWRAEVDTVLASVAMGAGTGTMSASLMSEETSIMEGTSPCSTSTQFQIAAYQALLASLLSPCCHRPPYLAQALTVFRNGKSLKLHINVGSGVHFFCDYQSGFASFVQFFLLCTGSPFCILSRYLLAPYKLLKMLRCYLILVYWIMVLNVRPLQLHISHIWTSCVSFDLSDTTVLDGFHKREENSLRNDLLQMMQGERKQELR